MNQKKSTLFSSIRSKDDKFEVVVGKPVNAMVNLFFNFNVFAYKEFCSILEQLPYLTLHHKQEYDDGTSGMAIELTEDNSLLRFVEDLPDLVYLYVENVEPSSTTHQGLGSK